MLSGTRESMTVETSHRAAVGAFRCVRPLRRYRRVAVQSLIVVPLVVIITVLVSSHHRRTTFGQNSAASDILRRFVRSVSEASSGSGRLIIGDDGSNGYLVDFVNGSRLTDVEFRSYGDAVDLRLIVLAYDRSESLAACLESLETADYGREDRVALHVWIDGCPTDAKHDHEAHKKTIDVAQSFNFSHGAYYVHVRPQHVGVQVGDAGREVQEITHASVI